MPIAGFYDGYNEAREYWGNRRSEAARAFSEYRQLNPDSTYSDYKNFVDQLTGGNSYLRGGIPSDQILQHIGAQNAQRRQQEEMSQRLEMLRQQAQVSGTIGALAQNYATQFDNDAEVEDALVASLGGGDAARSQVRKMYANGFGPIRQRAQAAALKDNLPLAIQLLQTNPDTDLSSVFPEMPRNFLSSIQDSAKRKIQEEKDTRLRSQQNDLITAGKLAIDMGGSPSYSGFDPEVVERATPILSAYKSEFDRKRTEAEAARRDEKMRTAVDAMKRDPGVLAAFSKPGSNPISIFKNYLAQYGISDLKDTEIEPFLGDVLDDSVALKSEALKTQRDKTLTDAKTEAELGHKTAVESITSMLGNDADGNANPLAARAGPYAAGAVEAVKGLGLVYDLSDPGTRQMLVRSIDAGWLEAHGADPADYGSIQNAIMSDPEFKSRAVTIKQGNAGRELLVKNSTGLPENPMTFNSWASTYRAQTADDIQTAEEKIVLPALAQGPNADGTVGSDGQIDMAIAQLQRLKQQAGVQFKSAASASDVWLLPGSPFDFGQAQSLAIERATAYDALIQKLVSAKQAGQQAIFSRNAAANDAAQATRQQEQKINSMPTQLPTSPVYRPAVPDDIRRAQEGANRSFNWTLEHGFFGE